MYMLSSKHKEAPVFIREREMSSVTFAHVLNCRVLAVKYSVWAPKMYNIDGKVWC